MIISVGEAHLGTVFGYAPSTLRRCSHYESITASMHVEGDGKGKSSSQYGTVAEELIRAAKIHNFCLGIPFGVVVIIEGIIEYLFSKNTARLKTAIYGAGLLFSTLTSFILNLAAMVALLIVRQYINYSMTKQVFPAAFYAALSASMICFYSYVRVSRGNPPPKKLKFASSSPS
ncbi:hypothetical protein GIB67_033304 [Kingdonia uniflora]|nr:hypothetical protein GIB67_033304 [Kingdonia uniflora]